MPGVRRKTERIFWARFIIPNNLLIHLVWAFQVNHELFFDQCAKIDHQGKELTKPIYRIFPRTYKVSERDNIMAYGFAPSESSYAPSFFKCRYDQASGLNVRRGAIRASPNKPINKLGA
ncbi:hypothetical protein PGT21_033546 [Puccinia graminis f. sp. tritici]|uniref:Uncharacterized protein n=1 Tax=Puccinia graminis f. sp. tritici TaxID=56615 RepID=A0A5B0P9S7_PUCGR|nr:hypothetical protein PGT21_033546 [Puccinia graminis f. sp. tritici]